MKYNQPYGVSDPNAPYVNGNPSTGTMGSIPPAASIEYPQREIVNFISDNGLAPPDNADLRQLSKGIQSGLVNFAVDTGVVNQMSVNLSPPVTAYYRGLRIYIMAVAANTGATLLSVNGLTFQKVIRRDGCDLKANDITANSIQLYVYDGTNFQLFGAGMSGGAGLLTQNLHIYVNWTIGNDANDGTANDAAHAIKTPQQAINLAFIYPPSQYTITIHIADSPSYPGFFTPYWSGPNIIVIGNEAAPQNVVLTGQNNHAVPVSRRQHAHLQRHHRRHHPQRCGSGRRLHRLDRRNVVLPTTPAATTAQARCSKPIRPTSTSACTPSTETAASCTGPS